MRNIFEVMEPRFVAVLICKECNNKATFYFESDTRKDCRFPTNFWNGWYLNKTELCPICYLKKTHTITKDGKGRITYTPKHPKVKANKNG
jgi:hypothetical protein